MPLRSGKHPARVTIFWLSVLGSVSFALVCLANAVPASAQVYPVGGIQLTIPAPPGDNLVEMGSFRTMMEVYVPDSNRLVAGFLLPDDLKLFQAGTRTGLRHYAMVEVPRSAESTDISETDFQQTVTTVDQQFASSADSPQADAITKQGEDELNKRLKALNLNVPHTTLEKPVMLGKFFSKSDAYSFGMLVPVSANGNTVNMLTGVVFMRVRSRYVYVYLYTEYKGDQTEPWMRTELENWADAILSANAQ